MDQSRVGRSPVLDPDGRPNEISAREDSGRAVARAAQHRGTRGTERRGHSCPPIDHKSVGPTARDDVPPASSIDRDRPHNSGSFGPSGERSCSVMCVGDGTYRRIAADAQGAGRATRLLARFDRASGSPRRRRDRAGGGLWPRRGRPDGRLPRCIGSRPGRFVRRLPGPGRRRGPPMPRAGRARWLRPGAVLVSMLHYPTRPERTALLTDLGVRAVSLDAIIDRSGRRLVENLEAVAWNGVRAAFREIQRRHPHFDHPSRRPLHVTCLGSGGGQLGRVRCHALRRPAAP